ncbi:hypothetical protein COCOBI_17-2410 [Coccomyxa sp. Obi]|nr:hypothetical protein COCOBI_17-2410 [Coccomyxa sp. Obi]
MRLLYEYLSSTHHGTSTLKRTAMATGEKCPANMTCINATCSKYFGGESEPAKQMLHRPSLSRHVHATPDSAVDSHLF